VNASLADGVEWGTSHFALHYPASLPGHAFGFNSHGVALSMNSLHPESVRTAGVGVFFLASAALRLPSVLSVVDMLDSTLSAYGASLNIGMAGARNTTNIEFGPSHGPGHQRPVTQTKMPAASSAPAAFHMNDYLYQQGVAVFPDLSSERRFARAVQLIRGFPASSRDPSGSQTGVWRMLRLHLFWRVLGDTTDNTYPLYHNNSERGCATVATATFELRRATGAQLVVHEGGNPLRTSTRVISIPFERVAARTL
jgi:hypothetical protein